MFESIKKIFNKTEQVDIENMTKVERRAYYRENPRGNKTMGNKYRKPTQKLTKNMKTALENNKIKF